ncbi:SH3 domain-containing protein, partial [Bacillus cereus]|nr:SH3 domain-containing protein [Bacillus cereus]
VLYSFPSGKSITGTWVKGEYVQGHYSNSNLWLKVTYNGKTGYVSHTALYNICQ